MVPHAPRPNAYLKLWNCANQVKLRAEIHAQALETTSTHHAGGSIHRAWVPAHHKQAAKRSCCRLRSSRSTQKTKPRAAPLRKAPETLKPKPRIEREHGQQPSPPKSGEALEEPSREGEPYDPGTEKCRSASFVERLFPSANSLV